ncbi:MAG: iron-sulfur cluster-binding domain-containing protein [Pseudomonadales bacterium]|nr:iron-sulfur cluster-binding domain-containing protein [Pseudomonadales bacterium]
MSSKRHSRHKKAFHERLRKRVLRHIRATVPAELLDRVPALMTTDVPSEDVSIRDTSYPVQVTKILRETDDAVTIRFKPMEGYRLHYRAGQYVVVVVQLGHVIFRRCYSLTSSPDEEDMAITVKQIFRGRVSKYLVRRLHVGDVISIEDPTGDFVLPQVAPYEQRYVMVAGGSGIAPVFALIKDILAKNPQADVHLLYTNRTEDDVIYRRSLDHMADYYKGFTLQYFYTRPSGRESKRELTPDIVIDHVADPSKTEVYISAPTSLTKAIVAAFEQSKITESKVHFELFGATPPVEENTELRSRVVSFYRRSWLGGYRHTRQRDVETILETGRKNGIKMPSRCNIGSCGKCKLKLKQGTVIMDEPNNLSLEDAEDGYILPCVAYPCESVVVRLPK